MTKLQFLLALHQKLSGLPQRDVEERLSFYSEMIEDRIEEGYSEEDAVAAVGSVEEVAAQITAEIPLSKTAPEQIKPRKRIKVWEIILLVLGSPVWLSLLIAAFAVILSLYISLWAVLFSLWAVFVSFAACSIGGVLACVSFTIGGNGTSGLAMLSAGIACAGLSIFMFYGCKAATKGSLILTKKMAIWIMNCLMKKEEA